MSGRHAIAALAHPRAQWPTSVARWATSGAVPVELLTCLSPDELTALFASGRRLSAVLLDGASSRVDQQLVAEIRRSGAEPVGVQAVERSTDWDHLGISSVLHADFGRDDLVDLLDTTCRGDRPEDRSARGVLLSGADRRATVMAVCGSGGCGTSVVAMALAQALAGGTRESAGVAHEDPAPRVLLIDGARRAHHAVYHHTGDVIPGFADLIGRVRRGTTDASELREMTFGTNRGYRLLLGATTLRDSASFDMGVVAEAIATAARHNDVVVLDHDGDLPEGHISGALSAVAALWVIVTTPGIKGLHDAVRLTAEACGSGVPAKQVLVVCNRVRRRDPARVTFPVEFSRVVSGMGLDAAPVLVLPEVRIEAIHRDVELLPRSITRPLASRARRMIGIAGADPRPHDEHLLVGGTT